MARRPLTADTQAIILALEHNAADAKQVAAEVALTAREAASRVAHELETHTGHDDKRFSELTVLVTTISTDIRSLLDTRTLHRGMWKMITLVGTTVSAVTTLIIMWFHR
jgi:hypothetical protein